MEKLSVYFKSQKQLLSIYLFFYSIWKILIILAQNETFVGFTFNIISKFSISYRLDYSTFEYECYYVASTHYYFIQF